LDDPGPLVDRFGRTHTEVRISVTDRCNVRCRYCMPEQGVAFRSHDEILRFEEIERFVRAAALLGVRKVRLTGGEPLVRKHVTRLVEMLARVPGIDDLAMTTNATLLPLHAAALKKAGLGRVNVSLDTLDRDKYRHITRRDELPNALEGLRAARQVGLHPIKLNALAIRRFSEDEVVPLARFAWQHGFELRFIEFMPLDGGGTWEPEQVLSGDDTLAILAEAFGPWEPLPRHDPHAPAERYRMPGGGTVGLIRSLTRHFCAGCSRLRLTADGRLRNCLFSPEDWDLRAALRDGATDRQLAGLIVQAVAAKQGARGTPDGQVCRPGHAMHQIGG